MFLTNFVVFFTKGGSQKYNNKSFFKKKLFKQLVSIVQLKFYITILDFIDFYEIRNL